MPALYAAAACSACAPRSQSRKNAAPSPLPPISPLLSALLASGVVFLPLPTRGISTAGARTTTASIMLLEATATVRAAGTPVVETRAAMNSGLIRCWEPTAPLHADAAERQTRGVREPQLRNAE
ncbi:hypothetical protein TSOC_007294 [Tetrabaena socialis]|uniref:Uncharacterized protein n=1 Tax=Tetrabaena socialis TaxID=47790 RepID=A0A2J8A1C3_9CHLO|nr:hypothetical protein TSOC_007294 [Tetrabaena socialis]|eukprot:PNH06322.1 hypothetical protein TSOC_007294 [Tetrabaena socialis]